MGFSELLVLSFLAFLLFGPKRTPEIARRVGSAIGQFKRAASDLQTQLTTEAASVKPARATIDTSFAAWTKSLVAAPPADLTTPLASTTQWSDDKASGSAVQ
jgi:TatA/E family protein of Tat protein translocase